MTTNGSKRRKLAHDSSDESAPQPTATSKNAQKAFFKNATTWNLEEEYENRRRKDKKDARGSNRLPIKTADGRLDMLRGLETEVNDDVSVESDPEWLEGREHDIDDAEDLEPSDVEEEKVPEVSESQQIIEAQEELAKLALAINEDPEENVSNLKTLAKIAESKIPTIQMLAVMTQMSVYKDIIPGYRIRPQTEDSAKEKLSKEVRRTRQYEQSLVSGYQTYIKELARYAKLDAGGGRNGQNLSSVATTCACTLAMSVAHFNFRTDLLKIIVNKLSRRRIDDNSTKCLEAIETLFQEDEEGRPSLEAVSLLAKMMKARDFNVDEKVLNLFLSLRLLSEFSGKGSKDGIDRQEEGPSAKMKKSQRQFRTKKERKAFKEQKMLEKDMARADAVASHEEREQMQSESLKLVFTTYFRILKQRSPHLMGAVLEGLAKYAHLINQDFFGDLLEALKDLIRHSDEDAETASRGFAAATENQEVDQDDEGEKEDQDDNDDRPVRNLTREALLCTVTASALLAGQDAHNSRNVLHLDLSFFTTHLYKSLLNLAVHADLENVRPNVAAAASSTASKINVQTTTVLLLRSLTSVLLPQWNTRSVPPLRIAAFTKQLMTTALQLPEKSCQGVLALLGDVAHTHGHKVNSLWNTEERKGDGRFNAVSDSVESSNPFAATVWEGELLRKHFSPKVREGVKLLEKGMTTGS